MPIRHTEVKKFGHLEGGVIQLRVKLTGEFRHVSFGLMQPIRNGLLRMRRRLPHQRFDQQ